MILAGIATLVWSGIVWRWQDPFTGLYTRYEQHKLASSYDERVADFRAHHHGSTGSLAAARRAIKLEARRYRLTSTRGEAIGRIKVPRLGIDMILVNGTDHDSLKRGPGRDLRTYMPGEGQLVYVAGHRTTYLAPFSHIDTLRSGDTATLELPYATFRYVITSHRIVGANDVAVLKSHNREQLILQACHPRFFASHRYLADAKLVAIVPTGGHAYSLAAAAVTSS